MINRIKRGKGVFTIELAFGLLFLSGMLVIVLNHLLVFNKKGALDRAAYSVATIISERKQLFNNKMSLCSDDNSCQSEAKTAYDIVVASLRRMDTTFDKSKLGMRIDYVSIAVKGSPAQFSLDTNKPLIFGNTHQCHFNAVKDIDLDTAMALLPKISVEATNLLGSSVYLPLYQVSLCYEIPLDLIGGMTGEAFRLISTSYTFARI
ncbi:tight adherence pilus pseudopilin TadF [Vibrio sp. SCSIO 43137]|uniref:tight adherence pilus pseudopilin TadF n=1 Tax=Vibrio sp. SCSIO 43137 TaxID=3021011 RepID=UPI0023077557|nr:tight adherence pilus pseudopilin TadF [Vibrio sp. SCSIO 43137]WCE32564.1 tight adherence pilus pseudopilin TadF [Vibrio sp. SCSIO 43137]